MYSTAPTSPEGQKRPHIWSRKQGPSLLPQTLNLETLLTLSFLLLLLSPHLSTFTYSYFCSAQSISPPGSAPKPRTAPRAPPSPRRERSHWRRPRLQGRWRRALRGERAGLLRSFCAPFRAFVGAVGGRVLNFSRVF